jgi:hypothetical protein
MAEFGWLGSWVASNLTRGAAPEPPPSGPLSPWTRYGRILRDAFFLLAAIAIVGGAGWYFHAHRQFDWAVIVVAGDWHAHNDKPSEGFDNARRDVSAELRAIGFRDEDLVQFSVRPERYPDAHAFPSDVSTIATTLRDLTNRTHDGCLLYFTSHGTPYGIVLGSAILRPEDLATIVDGTCGERPTVVIISACFSGVFVPALRDDNRMIVTAARFDRTSFGCTQDDKYPYFDTCVVADLPDTHGFAELADRVRQCVADREQETGSHPPSEPQVFIGKQIAAAGLPKW